MAKKIGLFLGLILFFIILLLPAPEGMTNLAKRVASVAVLMSIWWITEAIPIPATSLLPIILFPMLKIMEIKKAVIPYADPIIFLFIGGFFISMAMQRWNLHKRIALHIIRVVGKSPSTLILGFMLATAFISLWVSNTATTMMIYPIGLAVLSTIDATGNYPIALLIAIAYSASIGGIGTLIGTPPNIVFAGQVKTLFPDLSVSFLSWLKIGIPVVVVFLPITWLYLTKVVFRFGEVKFPAKEVIDKELKSMGKITKPELYTLIVFCLTAIAWITRPFWSNPLGLSKYIDDGFIAIFASIILFLIPVDFKIGEFVLNWDWAVKIPWGILLLFGGGLSLANGIHTTELDKFLAEKLIFFSKFPNLIIIMIICLFTTFLTEITSNTATATMLMPIMGALAKAINIHPFLVMVPATISASCAFMLPVATPPNAIIFGSGHVTIPQMAKAGLGMNFIGVIIVSLLVYILL